MITQQLLLDYIQTHQGCKPEALEKHFKATAQKIRWKLSILQTKGEVRLEFDPGSRRNYKIYPK